MIEISVITTTFNSSLSIKDFDQRIRRSLNKLVRNFEIIYVDDGSSDKSPEILKEICNSDSNTRAIIFSRNFGHHKAIMAGIKSSKGEWNFLIDSDLEESPEIIEIFWREKEINPDYEIFVGQQQSRKGGLFERISGNLLWAFINKTTKVRIPKNLITARLFSSRVREGIKSYQEKEIFIAHTFAHIGFGQFVVPISKLRLRKSDYNLEKKIQLAVDGITNVTIRPLQHIFLLGALISCTAFIGIFAVLYQRITDGISIPGWTSLILTNLLTSGVVLLSLGIIGLYISRIFQEVKGKPSYVIKEIFNDK